MDSESCDQNEVEKLIYKLQSDILENMSKFKDPSKTISKTARKKCKISMASLKRLNLIDMEPDPQSPYI